MNDFEEMLNKMGQIAFTDEQGKLAFTQVLVQTLQFINANN
jgi:hypothetical protein